MDAEPAAAASAAGSAGALRAAAAYAPRHGRFLLRERKYALQYSHIYTNRLGVLRPFVLSTVAERWGVAGGAARVCPKIVDLRPEEAAAAGGAAARAARSRPWVVCGCIYKEMALKPSVLDTYSGASPAAAAAAARAPCPRLCSLQQPRPALSPLKPPTRGAPALLSTGLSLSRARPQATAP